MGMGEVHKVVQARGLTLEIAQKEKEMGDRKYSPFSKGWGLEVQSLENHEVLHSCTQGLSLLTRMEMLVFPTLRGWADRISPFLPKRKHPHPRKS